MGNNIHNPFAVNDWWQEQPGVTTSSLIPYRNLSRFTFNGKEVSNIYLFMMNTPNTPFMIDQLLFSEGEKQLSPLRVRFGFPHHWHQALPFRSVMQLNFIQVRARLT